MGVRFGSQFSNVPLNPLPANGATTVIWQLGPLILPTDNALVALGYQLVYTTGPGTTAQTFTIYRAAGATGGSVSLVVWNTLCGVGAGNISGNYVDQPGGGSFTYCFTVANTGTTSAGTVTDGCLIAFVL